MSRTVRLEHWSGAASTLMSSIALQVPSERITRPDGWPLARPCDGSCWAGPSWHCSIWRGPAGEFRLRASMSPARSASRPAERHAWSVVRDDSVVSWRLPSLELATRWQDLPPVEASGRVGISSLAASSHWIVAGTRAGRILVLNASDGQLDHTARASGPIQRVAICPDGSVAACGTQRGALDLVRLLDGQPLAHVKAHAEMVTDVAFHPSGRYLATTSGDRYVVLWQVDASTLTRLLEITAASDRGVSTIRFSPDGRYLGILDTNDRAVRVWDLDRLRQSLGALGLGWKLAADVANPGPAPK